MTVTPATLGVELQYAAACDGRESESTRMCQCQGRRRLRRIGTVPPATGKRDRPAACSSPASGPRHARRSNTRGPPPATRYKHHCCSATVLRGRRRPFRPRPRDRRGSPRHGPRPARSGQPSGWPLLPPARASGLPTMPSPRPAPRATSSDRSHAPPDCETQLKKFESLLLMKEPARFQRRGSHGSLRQPSRSAKGSRGWLQISSMCRSSRRRIMAGEGQAPRRSLPAAVSRC